MTPAVGTLTTQSRGARTAAGRANTVSTYLPLESGTCSGKRAIWYVFINMDGLSMLSEIIQTGKAA